MDRVQIQKGQQLTWIYTPRGGYGWPILVDAEVLSVGKSRVKIQVQKVSGELVARWVDAENLRERKG